MANKKTLKDYFTELLAYDLTEEHRKFIEGRLTALDKKTTDRKPTATQLANDKLAAAVHAQLLATGKTMRVSDMMKNLPAFAEIEGLSQSKANAIVKKLKDALLVKRTEEKGVAYFTAVEAKGE